MAAVIGALRAELSASVAQFASDMGRAGGEVANFANRFQSVGRRLQGIGTTMSLAVTAPLVALGVHVHQAAADAEELQSAFDYSFGEMSDDMNEWARQTGDAMGSSTQAIQQAAFTFNQLFREAAPTGEAAADLSRQFAVLAQDLSSFYNVAESDAMDKLRAGLVGEAEPLRAFGVFLTAAAVEARALEMGLAATSAELTEQDKILARANLIMEATAAAQGDVARTADSATNKGRAFRAQLDELAVMLGQRLLPLVTPVVAFLTDILQRFSEMPEGVQQAIVVVGLLAAAIGPLLVVIGTLISSVGTIVGFLGSAGLAGAMAAIGPVILPVIAAVAALVAAFMLFRDDLLPVFEAFRAKVVEVLGPQFSELIASVRALLTELWEGPLGAGVRVVIDFLGQLLAAFLGTFGEALIRVVSAAIEIVTGIIDAVTNVVRIVSALLRGDWSGAWNAAKDLVMGVVRTVLGVLEALVPGALDAMRRLYEGVRDWLMDRLGAVFTWLRDRITAVGDWFFDLYDRVVGHSYIPDMIEGIAEWMARLPEVMVQPAQEAAEETATAFEDGAVRVTDAVESMATDSAETVTDVWGRATEEIGSGLADMIREGEVSLNNLLALAVQVLSKIGSEQFGGINFGSGGSGGSGGFDLGSAIQQGIGAIISGFRASGGPVVSGRSYIVGERGPELFTPNTSGGITANENAGGVTVNINGVPDPTAWRKSRVQLAAEIGRAVSSGRRGM